MSMMSVLKYSLVCQDITTIYISDVLCVCGQITKTLAMQGELMAVWLEYSNSIPVYE